MRTARPLGLSPDGEFLIVVTEDGEEIAIPADERLLAAARNDRPRLGQLEIDMESALRPREIQSRVRAGESLEEVAVAAGVPVEKVEPYAVPVLAERAHIAEMAQAAPVRRKGETTSTRTLRVAVLERLTARGVELADVSWDAWRIEGRRWHIQADYLSGSAERQATFTFDLQSRFSVATNEDAQWLIGDESTSHGPQPGRKRRVESPDSEPTLDLEDELALVRAVDVERLSDDLVETDDAYTPGDLEEVDGVYDIVPPASDLDVLYDMLSTFNEDSVQIYKGLTTPVVAEEAAADEDPGDAPGAEPTPEPAAPEEPQAVPTEATAPPDSDELALPAAHLQAEAATAEDSALPAEPARKRRRRGSRKPNIDQPTLTAPDAPTAGPAAAEPAPEAPAPETPAADEPQPPAQPKRRGRRRASVPSWDEIMFGSPTAPKPPGDDER